MNDAFNTELMIVDKLSRKNLFTLDALTLNVLSLICSNLDVRLKTNLDSLWTPIVHKILMIIDAEDIGSINEMGFLMYISYVSRGYVCLKEEVESQLVTNFKKHFPLSNPNYCHKLNKLIGKLVENHHQSSKNNTVVYCFNFLMHLSKTFNNEEFCEIRSAIASLLKSYYPETPSELSIYTNLVSLICDKRIPFNLIISLIGLIGYMNYEETDEENISETTCKTILREHCNSKVLKYKPFRQSPNIYFSCETNIVSLLDVLLNIPELDPEIEKNLNDTFDSFPIDSNVKYLAKMNSLLDVEVSQIYSQAQKLFFSKSSYLSKLGEKLLQTVFMQEEGRLHFTNFIREAPKKCNLEKLFAIFDLVLPYFELHFFSCTEKEILKFKKQMIFTCSSKGKVYEYWGLFLANLSEPSLCETAYNYYLRSNPVNIEPIIKIISSYDINFAFDRLYSFFKRKEVSFSDVSPSLLQIKSNLGSLRNVHFLHQEAFNELALLGFDCKNFNEITSNFKCVVEDALAALSVYLNKSNLAATEKYLKNIYSFCESQKIESPVQGHEIWERLLKKYLTSKPSKALFLWTAGMKLKVWDYLKDSPAIHSIVQGLIHKTRTIIPFNTTYLLLRYVDINKLNYEEQLEYKADYTAFMRSIFSRGKAEDVVKYTSGIRPDFTDTSVSDCFDIVKYKHKIDSDLLISRSLVVEFINLRNRQVNTLTKPFIKDCYVLLLEKIASHYNTLEQIDFDSMIVDSQGYTELFPLNEESNFKTYSGLFLRYISCNDSKSIKFCEHILSQVLTRVFEKQHTLDEIAVVEMISLFCSNFDQVNDYTVSFLHFLQSIEGKITILIHSKGDVDTLMAFYLVLQKLGVTPSEEEIAVEVLVKKINGKDSALDTLAVEKLVHNLCHKNSLVSDKKLFILINALIFRLSKEQQSIQSSSNLLKRVFSFEVRNSTSRQENKYIKITNLFISHDELDVAILCLKNLQFPDNTKHSLWMQVLEKLKETNLTKAYKAFLEVPEPIFQSEFKSAIKRIQLEIFTHFLDNDTDLDKCIDVLKVHCESSERGEVVKLYKNIVSTKKKQTKARAWDFLHEFIESQRVFDGDARLRADCFYYALLSIIDIDYRKSCEVIESEDSLTSKALKGHLTQKQKEEQYFRSFLALMDSMSLPLKIENEKKILAELRKREKTEKKISVDRKKIDLLDSTFIKKFANCKNLEIFNEVVSLFYKQIHVDESTENKNVLANLFELVVVNYCKYSDNDIKKIDISLKDVIFSSFAIGLHITPQKFLDIIEVDQSQVLTHSLVDVVNNCLGEFSSQKSHVSKLKRLVEYSVKKLILQDEFADVEQILNTKECSEVLGADCFSKYWFDLMKAMLIFADKDESEDSSILFDCLFTTKILTNYCSVFASKYQYEISSLLIESILKNTTKENYRTRFAIGIKLFICTLLKNCMSDNDITKYGFQWEQEDSSSPALYVLPKYFPDSTEDEHLQNVKIIYVKYMFLLLEKVVNFNSTDEKFVDLLDQLSSAIFIQLAQKFPDHCRTALFQNLLNNYTRSSKFFVSEKVYNQHESYSNRIFKSISRIKNYLYNQEVSWGCGAYIFPETLDQFSEYKDYEKVITNILFDLVNLNTNASILHALKILASNTEHYLGKDPVLKESIVNRFIVLCVQRPFITEQGEYPYKYIVSSLFPNRKLLSAERDVKNVHKTHSLIKGALDSFTKTCEYYLQNNIQHLELVLPVIKELLMRAYMCDVVIDSEFETGIDSWINSLKEYCKIKKNISLLSNHFKTVASIADMTLKGKDENYDHRRVVVINAIGKVIVFLTKEKFDGADDLVVELTKIMSKLTPKNPDQGV
ncbi:MAG: hypothetical protein VX777_09135 [Chlamydiota bacterium]|nr:hypothetical protein [Chlamydiota bacterium]